MQNLIDRDALIAKIQNEKDEAAYNGDPYVQGIFKGLVIAECFALGANPVNAAPAVHGEWIGCVITTLYDENGIDFEDNRGDYYFYVSRCSVCGSYHYNRIGDTTNPWMPRFCPNCGAKMDGGNAE